MCPREAVTGSHLRIMPGECSWQALGVGYPYSTQAQWWQPGQLGWERETTSYYFSSPTREQCVQRQTQRVSQMWVYRHLSSVSDTAGGHRCKCVAMCVQRQQRDTDPSVLACADTWYTEQTKLLFSTYLSFTPSKWAFKVWYTDSLSLNFC